MKHRYECIKETLLCAIEEQMCNLNEVDAKELGEVVDMVKDLDEAAYYYAVTKAMEEAEEQEERVHYTNNHSMHQGHYEMMSEEAWQDCKMGRSPMVRKVYMEGKETNKDKTAQMRDLEKYMQELAQDIVEMIEGASPEERQYLSKKISALSAKLASPNG